MLILCLCWFMLIPFKFICFGRRRKQEARDKGISSRRRKRGCQLGDSEGGDDGCREANSATFSVFAWHCHPCQLLNASVTQPSVGLAAALALHSGRHSNIRPYKNSCLAQTPRRARIFLTKITSKRIRKIRKSFKLGKCILCDLKRKWVLELQT